MSRFSLSSHKKEGSKEEGKERENTFGDSFNLKSQSTYLKGKNCDRNNLGHAQLAQGYKVSEHTERTCLGILYHICS